MAKYSKSAGKKVETAMKEMKKGSLKTGTGKKVTDKKQAVAIGLSQAKKNGARVPAKKAAPAIKSVPAKKIVTSKKAAPVKKAAAASRISQVNKGAVKKAAPARKAVSKQAVPIKIAPAKNVINKNTTPLKKAAPSKKVVPKNAAPVKKATPAKKVAAKKVAPVKKAAPAKKVAAKKVAPVKRALPATKVAAKKVFPVKKVMPAKKVAAKKITTVNPSSAKKIHQEDKDHKVPSTESYDMPADEKKPFNAETEPKVEEPGDVRDNIPVPVEEAPKPEPDTEQPAGNPIPEDLYSKSGDNFHGHSNPTQSKSAKKPAGKKPLWNS